jgi:hypothetical protein
VFVFAVSQLSHHLLAHLSWRTVWTLANPTDAVLLTAPPYVALILVGATLWILAVLDRDGVTAGAEESV